MITNLKLKFGRTPTSEPEDIPVPPITVFVGPNNSGKSKVISEIAAYCSIGAHQPNNLILDNITFEDTSEEKTLEIIQKYELPLSPGEALPEGHILFGSRRGRNQLSLEALKKFIAHPQENSRSYCQWFLSHATLMLDGSSRINLINEQIAGDLQQAAQTSLQVLLRDDTKRHEVRRIIYEAFNTNFVVDPTFLGKLRIRLSERPPTNNIEERGIHAEAVAFHSAALPIELSSDGVKAFTGIITELIAGDPGIVMIDEPEAFLHPSLASKLGLEISRAALKENKRVFVSTHSTSFVMGCIHSGAPVNIIRLTYRQGVSTARVLPSGDILELMRNPLLRSTGVLSGLFYEFVIVTESDADRAFYQEINERLLRFSPENGIPNCLFINAQNKQTIQTIIKPLRQLGIPAAGIVDIDVLKDGGSTWSNMLKSINIPEISHNSLAAMRVAVKQAMEATGRNMKRDGGINILNVEEKEAAENLLNQLAEYGMFTVPNGELESWLPQTKSSGHGPSWLIEIFEKMGEDPSSEDYIKPSEGDVWQFLSKIKLWHFDANRKGIPL
ncbi:putative ATPase [Pseudomonas sp. 24 E 1]|uniref:ATP-dependent nuclease n=1 Tax=Pseudomonas sp. 24 E 1 TaxID=1844094 RepID=UPI0008125F38|nr:AAA family ATPase [Pseudomonas sp. 24 E 1]CRM59119.1 putative ATPase [Pseudomonas sp. 24 E 1]